MMKPGMHGSRINQVGKRHLVDIPQPLVNRVGNDFQDQRVVDCNKTIDRVVDDFADRGHCCCFVKGPERADGKSTIAAVNKLNLKVDRL